MRVHRLELTAFGPFAGTEVVDFDVLNEAGIFLLTGATGAGKTTILDAICFGLFGAVPGARNGAKDLKSHHASSDAVPTVVLDVSLRGRRFRTRRSPAWTKPSRRARAGYVDQHAKASIEEQVGGQWVALSTRIDDVTLLVTRVLGMNRDQFCQVVMLPQGQFQTFLRAGAKERHEVLESLFETTRFGRIEAWLSDHRRACERALEFHESAVCQLLARALEVGGALGDTVRVPVDRADVASARQVLGQVVAQTATAAFAARQDDATTRRQVKEVQHLLDGARDLAAKQLRHRDARERLRELQTIRDVVEGRVARVERAEAAQSFTPLTALLGTAERELDAARDHVAVTRAVCVAAGAAVPTDLTPDRVDTVVSAHRDALARLESLVEVEEAAERLTERGSQTFHELRGLERHRDSRRDVASALPTLLDEARMQLHEHSGIAAAAPADQERLAQAESCLAAAHEVAMMSGRLAELARDIAVALDTQLLARSDWLDLRERRLQGMAAELAGQLSAGVGCLVCGSPVHPDPAVTPRSPVSADAEAVALETSRACDDEHARLLELAASLRADLAGASARAASLDVPTAEALVTRTGQRLADAIESRQVCESLAQRIEELDTRCAEIGADLLELDARCTVLKARRDDDLADLGGLRADLLLALGPGGRVQPKLTEGRVALAATVELAEAVHEQSRCERTHAQTHAQLLRMLEPSGFVTVDDVLSAAMADVDIAAAEALNRAYDAEVRDATRVVDDHVLSAAAALPEPDLTTLEARLEEADEVSMQARAAAERLATQRDRLESLVGRLDDAISEWQPLARSRDVAASVAAMCAGTAADNVTKTKLSHYVLAARLEQVVAAANLRLGGIGGGRYQLEHSMERSVGDSRGGLGLLVLDTYTGRRRDPATLSGGETFYVSLALALGLADIVRDEVGGAELSTLFVDEGFGGLDTRTLDEVLDEIDSLRSGGRCVGLVSHLSDLRNRVPTQLQITATPTGATIAAR